MFSVLTDLEKQILSLSKRLTAFISRVDQEEVHPSERKRKLAQR